MGYDSVDKIIEIYFTSVTAQNFEYKGKLYTPKPLYISPTLFRGFSCPEFCGGCCKRYTMDYLPVEKEKVHLELVERTIYFNTNTFIVFSEMQVGNISYYCKFVNTTNGRCIIHNERAFSCDFELLRFVHKKDSTWFGHRLYGRGWQMLRCDSARGALCKMLPYSEEAQIEIIRKLNRLITWCEYFGLRHKVGEIIDWVEKGPHKVGLVV